MDQRNTATHVCHAKQLVRPTNTSLSRMVGSATVTTPTQHLQARTLKCPTRTATKDQPNHQQEMVDLGVMPYTLQILKVSGWTHSGLTDSTRLAVPRPMHGTSF